VVRKHQCVGQHNILPPPNSKHDHFGNIIWGKRLHALVHLLRFLLVATKPDNTEFRLHLPRINLDDANPAGDELLAHSVGKGAHCSFARTVNAAALVGLTTSDGANVHDIALAAQGPLLENREDGLRHGDEAGYVGAEHGVDVCWGDVGGLRHAFDEATAFVRISSARLLSDRT
jgi:hypothetical protein